MARQVSASGRHECAAACSAVSLGGALVGETQRGSIGPTRMRSPRTSTRIGGPPSAKAASTVHETARDAVSRQRIRGAGKSGGKTDPSQGIIDEDRGGLSRGLRKLGSGAPSQDREHQCPYSNHTSPHVHKAINQPDDRYYLRKWVFPHGQSWTDRTFRIAGRETSAEQGKEAMVSCRGLTMSYMLRRDFLKAWLTSAVVRVRCRRASTGGAPDHARASIPLVRLLRQAAVRSHRPLRAGHGSPPSRTARRCRTTSSRSA